MNIKSSKKIIVVLLILAIFIVTTIMVYCVSCSRSNSDFFSKVTALSSISGTSVSNSYGRSKGIVTEVPGHQCCVLFGVDTGYALMITSSQFASSKRYFWNFCFQGSSRQRNYPVGSAGGYVYTYVRSYCMNPSASITAYLGGYCGMSKTLNSNIKIKG